MEQIPPHPHVLVRRHEATYPHPFRVRKGDRLLRSDREDGWDGHRWIWLAADGREGWAADNLPTDETSGRAAFDTDAMELTARPGETLTASLTTHGRMWRANDRGEAG